MLYYMGSKKHLPGRIVSLRVPFPGQACPKVHVRTAIGNAGKTFGVSQWSECENMFNSPTEYSLKNASFRLHPVWGTHPADPAVTIAEVLPLCPSWINENVGNKYKSQATQLGQNLSHIDAYNGEKRYMWKHNTCAVHEAQINNQASVKEAPRYDECG